MPGLDPREAESGMWPALGLILVGGILHLVAIIFAVGLGLNDLFPLVMGLAWLIGGAGAVMLIVKVVRDRQRDQKDDRYSRDVDR
ncbi:MAG: hypothetical protein GC199_06435 [Alphaproteobacteria bacterium]|nr:hypothetical protein [Alphaproteobacteria bacterium]